MDLDSTMQHEHQFELQAHEQVPETAEVSEDQWKALAKIVRDVGPMLTPEEEIYDVTQAEAAVQAKDLERSAVVDAIQNELRALSRTFTAAQKAAQRPPTHPSSAAYEAQLAQLQSKQLALGKAVNDEEKLVVRREAEVSNWKEEQEKLSAWEVGKEETGWDTSIVMLKMFADAGFSLVQSDGTDKVLIRNDAKDDVHLVAIDPNRSKANTANLIWGLASE